MAVQHFDCTAMFCYNLIKRTDFMEQTSKKIAVITGAAGGIGQEFVKILTKEPLDEIWVIGRNAEKLKALRGQLGEKIIPVCKDLTDEQDLSSVHKLLRETKPVISYLINNAGTARMAVSTDFSADEIRKTIELNCAAPAVLINYCVPFMEKGSKIINVSSASAFQPVPYINLYASSKAFERSYSRALNAELKPLGITVTAVCPSWVDTKMLTREINGKKVRFPGMAKPEKVARKAIKDAKKGRDMSVCSLYVKCQHFNVKLMPQRQTMKIWLHGVKKYL